MWAWQFWTVCGRGSFVQFVGIRVGVSTFSTFIRTDGHG